MQSDKIKGIIAIEPGSFPFPEGEVPATQTSRFGDVAPMVVPKEQFEHLTKIPIVIYFGDFIPDHLDGTQGGEQWYVRLQLAKQWAEVVNKYGGNVSVVELPKVGIKGNTHFMMSDTNNQQVANAIEKWMVSQGLNQ